MKKIPFIAALLLLAICSCTKKMPSRYVLKTNNLPGSYITINSDSAYRLQAPKGAIIKIPKDAFDVPANTKVDIEIKEAYSGRDIILAGLTTMSNGRPLRSGGMIYFNATVAGKKVDFKKKVGISVPTQSYDNSMQLFKGEIKEDSSVNWIEPAPLDSPGLSPCLLAGKAMFEANCRNCHKSAADYTGPALAGVRRRVPPGDWIYRFIKSPAAMIGSNDPHSKAVFGKYAPTVMTAFPVLQKNAIDAILDYSDYVAGISSGNFPATSDFCGYDTIYLPVNVINTLKPWQPEPIDTTAFTGGNNVTNTNASTPNNNTPTSPQSTYKEPEISYNFNIDASGWFNVDRFLNIAAEVTLKAHIEKPPTDAEPGVYLFCPQKKIFMQATKKGNGDYLFDKYGEKAPLTLDDDAIVLAFTSKDKKMYYGAANFKIAVSQTISLHLKETTGEGLKQFFDKNKIDDISLDVYTDEKTLIPKPCDAAVLARDTLKP